MEKSRQSGMASIRYTALLVAFLFLSSCASESPFTNAPKHVSYEYLFPTYAMSYHPGDTITLTWKAVPTQEQADQEHTIILKAAFTQNPHTHGDLSKPITVSTTNWAGKTYTMMFQIPKDTTKQTYELVASLNIETKPAGTAEEVRDPILIE